MYDIIYLYPERVQKKNRDFQGGVNMLYVASVRNKVTKNLEVIKSDYPNKKSFATDLRHNGYAVRFIATPDAFDNECLKWYNRRGDYSGGVAK